MRRTIGRGISIVAASLALALPQPALAWGKTGHRVIAAIADTLLSKQALIAVAGLLGPESLDEASTWPDEMRAEKTPFWQKFSPPWHYVTIGGIAYDQPPPEGDALLALDYFRGVMVDPAATPDDKRVALRFIVHLVGDLHQPLHVGAGKDRGGNDVKVIFFGKPTNLHAVWDSALVDDEQLSFTELAERLERHLTDCDVAEWRDLNPRDWVLESALIRDTVYPTAPDLSYEYVHRFTPVMERRLQQGGVRLAAYLDDIFAHTGRQRRR